MIERREFSRQGGSLPLVVVAGKNSIAVDVLQRLLERCGGSVDLGVVCNGNETGANAWQKSLRFFARRWGVPELALEGLYGEERLVFLSLEFDRIVKPGRFRSEELYNIHFSLLPKYKGMYTSALPILNGEERTGVTLHRIDAGIDTGDVIAQKEIPIGRRDTSRDVYGKCVESGTRLVLEHLDDLVGGAMQSTPQPAEGSTYYSKRVIDYSNLEIDLNQTAEGIDRQIRAFSFREYQLPEVYGRPIVASSVTSARSLGRPGTLVFESESEMMLNTVDYDIVLHVDRLDDLVDACRTGDLRTARELCRVPGLVDARNECGWTPLVVAAYHGNVEVMEALLSAGADPRTVGNNGTTLPMYAKDAYLATGSSAAFDLCMRLGLDLGQEDYFGKSLAAYVAEADAPADRKRFLMERIGR